MPALEGARARTQVDDDDALVASVLRYPLRVHERVGSGHRKGWKQRPNREDAETEHETPPLIRRRATLRPLPGAAQIADGRRPFPARSDTLISLAHVFHLQQGPKCRRSTRMPERSGSTPWT